MNIFKYNNIRAIEKTSPMNPKKHTWFFMHSILLIILVAAFCIFSTSQNVWAADHGDSLAAAEYLTLGTTLTQVSNWTDWDWWNDSSNGDWYEFDVVAGDVDFTFHRYEGSLKIYLRNSGGGEIWRYPNRNWWRRGATTRTYTRTMAAGKYYIQILNTRNNRWSDPPPFIRGDGGPASIRSNLLF